MHAVIRKRQGLPWEKETPKGFAQNSSHIARVAAIPNFEPTPEEELSVAYGAQAYPKLVREMNSHLLTLQLQALQKMLEMIASPRHISSFIAAGCVDALNVAARCEDAEARNLSTIALARLAREDAGRKEMIAKQSINVLVQCAADESAAVRRAAFEAVSFLALTMEGLCACHKADFVSVTVARCTKEGGESDEEVNFKALGALHQLSKNDPAANAAVDCGAIEMCVKVG